MITKGSNKTLNDLGEIYKKVKENTILGYRLHGLSLREISRRLGGSTPPVVKKILDELEGKEK